MGWEVELNAISPECKLLQLVSSNKLDPELLSFVRSYFRLRRKQGSRVDSFISGYKDYEILVDALEQLVSDHPGIETRCCDLDRRFEWLTWLLTQSFSVQDAPLAEIAIRGEALVTPTARSVQGFPIRWTSPATCERISIWLSGMNRPLLRSKYDPISMSAAHLYKWHHNDPEVAFEWMIEDFNSLQRLYRAVVSNSEAVLVVTD
ncbi:MAG: YfbM family protein [Leptolyngbya sp. Prado105]|jgi:hypothetical protein|nr:YfbM family protein [Leptolyngbya sp. Prado105]